MKVKQLLVLSVLALGVQGAAQANFPADAEWSQLMPYASSFADQQALKGEGSTSWGVSKRQVEPHNPFPFGGGYISD